MGTRFCWYDVFMLSACAAMLCLLVAVLPGRELLWDIARILLFLKKGRQSLALIKRGPGAVFLQRTCVGLFYGCGGQTGARAVAS